MQGDGLFFSPPRFACTADLTFIFDIFTNQAAIRLLRNTWEKQKVDQSVSLADKSVLIGHFADLSVLDGLDHDMGLLMQGLP